MKSMLVPAVFLLFVGPSLVGLAAEEGAANHAVLTLSRAVQATEGATSPEGYQRMDEPGIGAWYVDPSPLLALKSGDVTMVEALESDFGYSLRLTMKPHVAAQFSRLTRRLQGQHIAILGDGRLFAVPKVIEPIQGSQVIVSGKFTEQQATDYAKRFDLELRKVEFNVPVPAWVRDPHHRAAFSLALRRKTDEAIAAYEELLAEPGDDPLHTFRLRQELGALYVAAGNNEDARAMLKKALAAEPPVTQESLGAMLSCYHGLINLAEMRGDGGEARTTFGEALERVRKLQETGGDTELANNALLQEGYLQLKYGDLDAADEIAAKVVDSGLDFQGYVLQGLLAELRGEPMEAAESYAMASRSDPELADVAKDMINKAAQGGGNVKGLRRPIAPAEAP
jgi:tetratricopeptide (TPR) repeat protein